MFNYTRYVDKCNDIYYFVNIDCNVAFVMIKCIIQYLHVLETDNRLKKQTKEAPLRLWYSSLTCYEHIANLIIILSFQSNVEMSIIACFNTASAIKHGDSI